MFGGDCQKQGRGLRHREYDECRVGIPYRSSARRGWGSSHVAL